MARLAAVEFNLESYSGSGCPATTKDAVRKAKGTADKSVLALVYEVLRARVEGLSDGRPNRTKIECYVTISITYNADYKISYRYMHLRGDRFFDPGATGFMSTVFLPFDDQDTIPDFTTRHEITDDEERDINTRLDNKDKHPRGCGEKVWVTMGVGFELIAGSKGEGADVGLTASDTEVRGTALALDISRCGP